MLISNASRQNLQRNALLTMRPAACLQDTARSFAGSTSDDAKFQLYMAATGFDVMMRQMNASQAEVELMVEKFRELNDLLEVRSLLLFSFSIHRFLSQYRPLLLSFMRCSDDAA